MAEPWYGKPGPAEEALQKVARETVARITEREEVLTSARRFVLAAVEHPSFLGGTPEQGTRWLLYAWRGRCMREHFEQEHPESLQLGEDGAPKAGIEREGWLWGYRWTPEVLS